jgi:hypothetical protein
MDDLRIVRQFGEEPEEPDAAARHRAARRLERAIDGEIERRNRRAPGRTRVWGFSAVGGAAVLAAVILAVMLLSGGSGALSPDPALAAEAVKKAVIDTASAADSGVIRSVVTENGVTIQDKTFSWNGDDFAIEDSRHESPNPNTDKGNGNEESYAELRYVADKFYEMDWYITRIEARDGKWYHCTLWDDGGAVDGFNPSEWLTEARSDLLGEGLVELVTSASGFSQTLDDAGDRVYSGSLTLAQLAEYDLDLSGAPFAGSLMRALLTITADPSAGDKLRNAIADRPVKIEVTVGAKGLLQDASFAYSVGGEKRDMFPEGSDKPIPFLTYKSDYVYTITYSQLGSAPAIEAPDPAHTITTDKPEGYRMK